MKFVLTTVFVIFFSQFCLAQENETAINNWVVGGTMSYINSSSDNRSQNNLSISPLIGKQINQRSIFGLSLYYNRNKRELTNDSTKSNGYGFGLFYRHTFNPQNKLQFFLSPSINFRHFENEWNNNTSKTNTLSVGSGIGLAYDLHQKWRLTTYLGGINYNTSKDDDGTTSNLFAINIQPSNINLGIEFKF